MFKTASRSMEDLVTAKADLDSAFEIVKGAHGKIDRSAFQKLNERKYELAELVVQLINDTVLVTDPVGFLAETVEGDTSNNYLWQEMDAALRVVPRSYGSKPYSQRLTFKEYSITTSHKEVAVEIPLERIASGRVKASEVVDAISAAIVRDRISTVLGAIDAGVPSATADRTGEAGYSLRYTGLTEGNLQKAVDGLMDEDESPTLFGRHIAIVPALRAFTTWSQDILTQFQTRGFVGTAHGANVVTLKDQYSKKDGAHAISKDLAWLAGATKGAIFMTKDVSFLNWSVVDEKNAVFGTGTRLEDGTLVHDPYRYRIFEL